MKRSSGVLMHISSLPGKYSCGSFGKEAREFIDFLADCGFSYWQVLPFCPIDEYNSPYKSHSSFGGNPYFIDLDVLFQKGLLTEEELKTAEQETPYLCEFERLSKERLELLSKAAKRAENIEEIEAVITQNSHLENFCRFMALKTANHFLPWQEWKTEKFDPEILFLWKFIQFEFFSQWKEIKAYANQKGIGIIGDIPFYVSPDSSDLWANTDLFQLDERNRPTAVAGVPPDYFCEDGQLWGNPLYDWDKMKEDGCHGAPDLVIEIASKSTSRRDYGIKMLKYRTAGVKEYWIVDPVKETVMVFWFEDEEQNYLYSIRDEIEFHIFPDLIVKLETDLD